MPLKGVISLKRLMCKGKIHRATVTEANLDYPGSVTIDKELMIAANIFPYEMVQITNLRNAARWKTYAIPGHPGSGTICLNGPPAHLFKENDVAIILSLGLFEEGEVLQLKPVVVNVDNENKITNIHHYDLSEWISKED